MNTRRHNSKFHLSTGYTSWFTPLACGPGSQLSQSYSDMVHRLLTFTPLRPAARAHACMHCHDNTVQVVALGIYCGLRVCLCIKLGYFKSGRLQACIGLLMRYTTKTVAPV